MLLAADYPFLGVFWSMLIFFVWIAWFMLLFHVIGDVFRRRDASGAKKTLWLIFLLFVPFLGIFVYLIANGDDMAKRKIEEAEAARSQMDEYVRTTAGSRRRGGRDREGQGAARQRCHHPGRVRRDQGQGPRVGRRRLSRRVPAGSPGSSSRCWPPPSPAAAAVTEAATPRPPSGPTTSALRSRPGRDSITSTAASLSGGNLNEDAVKSAVDDLEDATSDFVDDVQGLGAPDTEAGEQAKESLDQLADDADESLSTMQSAVDDVSGVERRRRGGHRCQRGHRPPWAQQLSSTFTELEQLDAGGELETAFNEADSCDELRSGG